MAPLWFVLALLPAFAYGERFSCRGRILGAYYADAKSGCKAFHVCVRVAGGGVRDFRFFCPPGTLFHQEAQTCTDWGDDDPLACPADLYDGYDTKKLSSNGPREDEAEFGLQRAEAGDRRSQSQSAPASDLRAAHSSDFFSGQRERGRDDPAPAPPAPSAAPRQSFRRPLQRFTPTAPPASTAPPAPPAPPSVPAQPLYDPAPKRKFVRKRPVFAASTTSAPQTFAPNYSSQSQQTYFDQQNSQNYVHRPSEDASRPLQQSSQFQQPQGQQQIQQSSQFQQPQQSSQFQQPQGQQQTQQSSQFQQPQQSLQFQQPQQPPFSHPTTSTPQYNEEYVEVSRVTPKNNKLFSNTAATSTPFSQPSQSQYFIKKKLPTELYNYEGQSTPALGPSPAAERPLKATVRNSFNVSPLEPTEFHYDTPRKNVEVNSKGARGGSSLAPEYNDVQKTFGASTPSYRNFNSVSYEPEKKSSASFSRGKQSFGGEPTQPSTTAYTTPRADPSLNLNTVAYKTNVGFNAQPANYAESDEDDGQYRPPEGEDDGQYRPEIYERELLSGAHSLNIAASGNRLPEDQKRTRPDHGAAPRPFSVVPTPDQPPQTAAPRTQPPYTQASRTPPPFAQTQRTPSPYTQPSQTQSPFGQAQRTQSPSAQRTFDVFQTYTTTSRPSDVPFGVQNFESVSSHATDRPTAPTFATKPPERSYNTRPASTRPPSSAPPAPPVLPSRPVNYSPKAPAPNKADASYDYAYYDTDTGFSEFDLIEDFGKTKKNV